MNRIRLIVNLFLLLPVSLIATDTLTLVQYQDMVVKNHPLVRSAELLDVISESYLLKGEGAFDPKLYTTYDGKQFEGTNYYRRLNAEVKIPTRYPVDFSLGYENNNGVFLNSENDVPSNGLLYGTVNVSVLRGLLFDEQRFQLRESELLSNKNEIEKLLIIRKVVIEGLNAYLDWSAAFNQLNIIEDYQERVSDRHEFVKQLFENGDKPAIDTIESRINLNTATKAEIHAREDLLWKRQKLNMFLWDANGQPLVLLETVAPEALEKVNSILAEETLNIAQNWAYDPIIRKKQNEVQRFSLENRLEREQLKPQLDIKFNTIHSLGKEELQYSYNVNDYKVGATLEVPLRNRKTKGQIQLKEAMINQNILDQSYYRTQLEYTYITLLGTQALNLESLNVTREKLSNSNLLYDAERLKFDLGESSVFLLNSREQKLLEAETDYIKTLKSLGGIYNELYFLKLGQE